VIEWVGLLVRTCPEWEKRVLDDLGTSGLSALRSDRMGETAYIKVLESTWSQADFHSLPTPDQSVKFVFVRTRSPLVLVVVLVLERCDDCLGTGAQSTRGSIVAFGRRYGPGDGSYWTLASLWVIDDMLYRCRG